MSRRKWILNHYAGNSYRNRGGRHYWFSKYLKRFGESPVVFCCNSEHNGGGLFFQDDSLWHERMAEEIQVPFVFVKGRPYVGNGLGRVLNVKAAAKEYAKENGRPDIILASSVHPLTLVAGIQLAKYFHAKCICEIRDLWPEVLISFGILKANNPITFVLRQMEKWIYKEADALIFTMAGAYDYIEERRWEKDISKEKVHYINNGVDLEDFDNNKEFYQIEDEDLQNTEIFKVVYTGAIRPVNGLGKLLDVARQIKNPRIKFLIWGKGDELSALQKRIEDEDMQNIEFKGHVDKRYIPYIVSQANLNLIHYGNMPVVRFGVSHNKMFEYMAAGNPTLDDVPCNYNPLVECDAGIEIKDPTVENIAKAVEEFADMDKETYDRYCCNARKGAEKYDFKNLTQELLKIMTGELHK